jgi:hypothetical protein
MAVCCRERRRFGLKPDDPDYVVWKPAPRNSASRASEDARHGPVSSARLDGGDVLVVGVGSLGLKVDQSRRLNDLNAESWVSAFHPE